MASLKVNLKREDGDSGMFSSQDSKGIFLNSYTLFNKVAREWKKDKS